MVLSDAYRRYRDFLDCSNIIDRMLSAYPQIRTQQGDHFYQCAQKLNCLLTFLAQFMAFNAFVNFCLREQGIGIDYICGMSLRQKVEYLAPKTAADPGWPSHLLDQAEAELELRHAWLHGCGDELLARRSHVTKEHIPQSVLDLDPITCGDWITGPAWAETASLLNRLVEQIADELGLSQSQTLSLPLA